MGLRTTSSAPTYRYGSQRSLPKWATATVSVPSGGCAGVSVHRRWPAGEQHDARKRHAPWPLYHEISFT